MTSTTPDTPKSSSATSRCSSGRGGGSCQQRGTRNSREVRTGQSKATSVSRAAAAAFKGDTEDMNGNVFQCYEEQSDRHQYSKLLRRWTPML
jgi:hypothetical protein